MPIPDTFNTGLTQEQISKAFETALNTYKSSDIDALILTESEAREAADEEINAALAELVDSGAKNLMKNIATSQSINGVDFTVNTDKTVTANGTASSTIILRLGVFDYQYIPDGEYVLSGCPAGGSVTTYRLELTSNPASYTRDFGEAKDFEAGDSYIYQNIVCVIYSGIVCSNLTFKPMICTKAAWDISQKYVPYRPSYQELYDRILALENQQ